MAGGSTLTWMRKDGTCAQQRPYKQGPEYQEDCHYPLHTVQLYVEFE